MPAVSATPDLAGLELGGCRLISRLGGGGMGVVYLAEQPRLGNRLVAVKIVRSADAVSSQDDVAGAKAHFTREGHLLAHLSHPNILPVYDSGVQDDLLYLVMQYAPDGSLADATRGRSSRRLALPVPLPLAANLLTQVAAALQYTHEHGIVHRDVKPANVLVQVQPSGQWHLMLADFGVARDVESTARMRQATGTIPYMAPEQFAGKFSPASDQYALGIMAYHLLAGRPPFRGEVVAVVRAHLYDPPPSLRTLNPAVTADVEQVIGRALAKDPADRYPTVAAFAAALSDAALAGAPTAQSAGVVPAPDPAATRPALTGGIAGAGLAAAAPLAAARVEGETGSGESTIALEPAGPAAMRAHAAPALPPVAAQRERRRKGSVLLAFAALMLLTVALAGAALKLLGESAGSQPPTQHSPPSNIPGSSVATPADTATPAVPTNAAQLVSASAPASVRPGQSFAVSATYANTGSGTWSAGAGYTLVCDTTTHPDSNCMGASSAGMGGASVAPGQQFTFTVSLTAPAAPGTYKMWWALAQHDTPIGAPDAKMQVTVRPAPQPTVTPTPQPTAPPTPAPIPQPTPVPGHRPTPLPTPPAADSTPPAKAKAPPTSSAPLPSRTPSH